ncbi:DUF3307 domain-containing protein [Halobacillus mangrovi]|uniref:DUF3307 domain-containing protein n=1 Tax=Halobacillus mangrovi TaxID=402384 RepID=UPI003D986E13
MIFLFLLFMLAHLIGDFITQNDNIAKYKRDKYRKKLFNRAIILHAFHHAIITILLLCIFKKITLDLVLATLIICFIHYFIDLAKSYLSDRIINKYKRADSQLNLFESNLKFILDKKSFYFITDQVFHIITIYWIMRSYGVVYPPGLLVEKVQALMNHDLVLTLPTTFVSLLIIFILISWASGYFVGIVIDDLKQGETLDQVAAIKEKDVFEKFYEDERKNMVIEKSWESEEKIGNKRSLKVQFHYFNEEDNNSAGMFIGILERILIALFVIINAYQGLIVIGALKTLARFKQFDAKSFAEYYLIGTLLSIILGLVLGGIAKIIIN